MTNHQGQIVYPHPSGRSDLAQAVLTVEVGTEEESGLTRLVSSITGSGDRAAADHRVVEVRTLEIPAWQFAALERRLEDEKFFRRSKALSSEVVISVVRTGSYFSKPFRSIPELDALLLRVNRDGRPLRLEQPTHRSHPVFRRTPPVDADVP